MRYFYKVIFYVKKLYYIIIIYFKLLRADKHYISIACLCEGGAGDNIIALAWIKKLYFKYQNIIIDIYCRNECHKISNSLEFIRFTFDTFAYKYILSYDIKLSISHFIYISKFNIKKIKHLNHDILNLLIYLNYYNSKFLIFIKYRPLLDGYWANICENNNINRWSELNIYDIIKFSNEDIFPILFDNSSLSIIAKFNLRIKKIYYYTFWL